MGYMNVEMMRNIFLQTMEEEEVDKFTPETLSLLYAHNMLDGEEDGELGEEDMEYVREVFSNMDRDQKGYVTAEELRGLDIETLKLVARRVESAHGPIGEDTGPRDEL
ncbi:Hypp2910 [Branchiostoma lanceolatum]|uniref:Hypp2910 protein n=1 Tax=Branchiostoma lanceolatum TaxID=7740 RepID=A0A8J9ZWM2_BRALA|nr:Hypp2910 [Branchiostoma lanceolatum]